jgi:eukaryotic-like serine/threonine-protein kinase
MFRDEARLAARIEHPNVCRVLDMGSVGDTYFLALEYLHGMPLSRVLVRAARSERPLDVRMVAGLLVQCCAGLHHAHELRDADGRALDVVHRDISPPNIFVTTAGLVKLLDFGVAKAHGASEKTRTGTVKGKNAYMSPEQVLGLAMDRRSDIFSVGIVLWEALTAQRLFMREVDFETFRAITEGDVPDVRTLRPDVPQELAEVVRRALSLDPLDRFASALELGDAVAAAVASVGGPCGERDIALFLGRRFAHELTAREQLLEATGVAVPRAEPRAEGTNPDPRRPTGDVSAEAATLVRDPAAVSQPIDAVEIQWTQSRKSQPMRRITTGSLQRMDETPPVPSSRMTLRPGVMAPGSSPSGHSTVGPGLTVASGAIGSRPIAVTSVDSRLVPRTAVASRARQLLARRRPSTAPMPATEHHSGQEAAAVVFVAGLFGLLILLWWLL